MSTASSDDLNSPNGKGRPAFLFAGFAISVAAFAPERPGTGVLADVVDLAGMVVGVRHDHPGNASMRFRTTLIAVGQAASYSCMYVVISTRTANEEKGQVSGTRMSVPLKP